MITRKLVDKIGGKISFDNLLNGNELIQSISGLKVNIEVPFRSPNDNFFFESTNFVQKNFFSSNHQAQYLNRLGLSCGIPPKPSLFLNKSQNNKPLGP